MKPRADESVRLNGNQPRKKTLPGELHLIRMRLDGVLLDLARLAASSHPDHEQDWQRVEQATRIATRAMTAAVAALPMPALAEPELPAKLQVGKLRVDTRARRQWYDRTEIKLSPLRHRLLATLASEPTRVFSEDELLRDVWGYRSIVQTSTVVTCISVVRRALIAAGAPREKYLITLRGVGWSLTRPS